jgi:Ca2+-binding RTX toxin-like protein
MVDVGPSAKLAVAAVVALSAFGAAAPPAGAATVAVFSNDTYVPAGGADAETDNVQSSLVAQDHGPFPFTEVSADVARRLLGRDAVLIPEQESSGDLAADLGPGGRAAYRDFVRNGGTLVINGERNGRAETFLNGVFDLGVDEQDTDSGYALVAAAAARTEFEGGPASLPNQAEVTGLRNTSLPAGTRALYANETHTGVALFHYGAGSVVFLGWDWSSSDPPNAGGQDGGWQDVLHRSVVTPAIGGIGSGVAEGDAGPRPMTFEFTLSAPASEEITVGLEVVGVVGGATLGQDVVFPSAERLTFPRGTTSQAFHAYVVGDTDVEADEGFEVRTRFGRNYRRPRPMLGTAFGKIFNDDPQPGRCANRRNGTDAADALDGTSAGDAIFGLGGNDVIRGGRERDCLRGGAGDDRLDGGDNADSLSGDAGNDRLSGGNGGDSLFGGAGNDRLAGGAGRNSHSGGAGNDRISARNGVGREKVNCGSGSSDRATVDRTDRVLGCESVSRP